MRFLVFIFAMIGLRQVASAREFVDATQARVQLSDHPVRVVTLAPSLAELVAEVLQMDLGRIVGVSERTDFPSVLSGRPSVGSFAAFSVEKVLSLKPDLVFATTDGNPKDRVEQLRELRVPVVVVRTSSLKDIDESFGMVAGALGEEKSGARLRSTLQKGLAAIRASIPKGTKNPYGIKRPRVLLQIGTDPLVVAGRSSFLNEALETVQAENVYGDLNSPYPKPNLEDAIHRNPDWILVLGMDTDLRFAKKMAGEWTQLPHRKGRPEIKTAVLQGDTLLRPSLRLLEGIALLRDTIYGRPK